MDIMDKVLDLENLLLDIHDGNVAVHVIGFSGLHQQADEQEMGQALIFVSKCLDKLIAQANEILDEMREV